MRDADRATEFEQRVAAADPSALRALDVRVLEVNLGRRCDLACFHCHQGSSPDAAEVMPADVIDGVLALAVSLKPELVDLTGGAPELHPDIRHVVGDLAEACPTVQLRTNLVALLEPGSEDLPALFARHGVRLLASLPSAEEAGVSRQRGARTFGASLEALRGLNSLGYGAGEGLSLDIVTNPAEPVLQTVDAVAEAAFRDRLASLGVRFDRLLSVTNTPVGRYREHLEHEGTLASYEATLRDAFNLATLPHLSCRHQIEVAWDGSVWDCDYNLGARVTPVAGVPRDVRELLVEGIARDRRIAFGAHCFACTAGAGSS
jgi:radical SAM/Cys-rich protein